MEQPSDICSARDEFERAFVRPQPGRTLIVGSRVYPGREDRRALYQQAEGWDAIAGEGVDHVVNLEGELSPADVGLFTHIECISVLEHTPRPWLVTANLERLLMRGGTLFLTVPFVWRVHAYPDDFWRFTVSGVRALFTRLGWIALRYAHIKLTKPEEKGATAAINVHDYPYLARAEVCAFGSRA